MWMRLPIFLIVAAFVLAGCNANQMPNASTSAQGSYNPYSVYPDYNPYNPASYAQTSGFYAGR